MTTKHLILGFALSLTLLSCSKDDQNGASISSQDAKVNAQIDAMNDDVTAIVEEQEASTYANAAAGKNGTDLPVSAFTNCATITRVPAFGTPPTAGQTVTKTIDFGSSCTLDNGNVVSGIITITFVYQPDATSHTITYSFDSFTHNGIAFNGDKTFTRTLISTEANPNLHPQVTMTMDLTADVPGVGTYRRVGGRVREIVEGFATPTLADNIYKITGSWVTTTPSGATQSSEITTPLRIKMSCMLANKPLTVYGIITIVREGTTATLDFGDGTCDNLAVFTVNGNSYNIILGN